MPDTKMIAVEAGSEVIPTSPELPDVRKAISMAIESGNIDLLERLTAWHMELRSVAAEQAMNHAHARFKELVPVVPRSKKGKAFKTRSGAELQTYYAPLEVIAEYARPVLLPLGLSYTWDIDETSTGKLKGTFILTHVDGAVRRYSSIMPPGSGQDGYAGAQTALKRLTMSNGLGIITEDVPASELEVGEPLSEEHMADIKSLLDEVKPSDLAISKMCEILECESFATLDQARYPVLVNMLEAKRR